MSRDASATRYVLHPGPIPSASDRDWHHIGVGALRELYLIPPTARVVVFENGKPPLGFREAEGDIHCWPQFRREDYPRYASQPTPGKPER